MAAALLLHAAIAVWLLIGSQEPAAPEVPVMVATLVQEPAPAPVPAPTPPKPAPQPKEPLASRASGPDQTTTMLPTPDEPAPKPETQSASKPEPTPAQTDASPTPLAPAAPEPQRATAEPKRAPERPEPKKDQLASRGPVPPIDNAEIGEREQMGDPYLNALWTRIERQRAPTTPIGSSGLHLEGIATWEVVLDRSGRVEALSLDRSSGSSELDAEARRMIVAAEPFPPPPPQFPDDIAVKVTIRLYPR